jgi:E3 ubiquitin-protein ligase DOA10
MCRICLENDDEENAKSGNPFINPCKCIGSMKYVHFKCLCEWTDSKKEYSTDVGIETYYWENLNCELCNTGLDLVVRGNKFDEDLLLL